MLKVMAMVLGVMHLLAFPVSAPQFPDRLPSVTKEKAESFGLICFWSGEVEETHSCQYKFNAGSNCADLGEVYEKRYFDGTGFISIKHTYAALVDDHYYAYGEVGYLKETNVCDLEGLAPVLLDMCLEGIPNSTVRVSVNSLTTAPENSNVFSEDSGELSPEEFAKGIRVVEIRKS
ncbi:hypothetical protein GQS_08315 [Thermococcus sp. 4557]|uniref:hypothetical protein n=1 Tax=Thermococcus sp. (strain CGMCC 1.5172 / 4557) TaxID=1042877 RepID=UPI000219EDAA|nr:hypothetical protein [Thermococcus sp. 4557]AEK73557.1 hypothetical protein GQS_08315 [Thermococcus sp. 4557]